MESTDLDLANPHAVSSSTKRESRLVLTGKWSQPLERFRRALRVTRTLRGSDLEAQDKTYAAEPYEKKKNSCDIIQNRPLCERRTVSRGNPRTTNTTRGANRTVREISHRRVNIKAVNNKSRGVFQNNGYIELYFQNFGVRPSEITPSKYEGLSQTFRYAKPMVLLQRRSKELIHYHFVNSKDIDPENQPRKLTEIVIMFLLLICELIIEFEILFIYLLPSQTALPPLIPFFLSDNLTFIDGVGDRFSLPISVCCGLYALEGFIKSYWKADHKGYQKIISGQFKLFDVNNPGTDITVNNWDVIVQPRTIIRMAMVISSLRLLNQSCTWCGEYLRAFDRFCLICPNLDCGKFIRLFGPEITSLELGRLASIRVDFLDVPNEMNLRADRYVSHLALCFKYACKSPSQPDMPILGRTIQSRSNSTKSAGNRLLQRTPSADIEQQPKGDSNAGLVHSEALGFQPVSAHFRAGTSNLRRLEESELPYFTSICIKEDTTLHDAALSGDVALVSELVRERQFDVNHSKGSTGTPLIAAIFSKSTETVRTLLKAGANALMPLATNQAPIVVAACNGNPQILGLLLLSAEIQSATMPKLFQDSIDSALFQVIIKQQFRMIPTLLYAGANPIGVVDVGIAPHIVDRTALSALVRLRRGNLARELLAEVWNRGLIDDLESKILSSALSGGELGIAKHASSWLQTCARDLHKGRTKLLQDRSQKALHENQFFELPRQTTPSTAWFGSNHKCELFGDGVLGCVEPRRSGSLDLAANQIRIMVSEAADPNEATPVWDLHCD